MFTGLITAMGRVIAALPVRDQLDLQVELGGLAASARIGDSIALSGVCCTVVEITGEVGLFRLSRETLERTWLGRAVPGTRVNLEGALRVGEALGGHLVQGHVDGVGKVVSSIDPKEGGDLGLSVPDTLRRYCVEKGSITVDGVSLTIAGIDGATIRIAVIPHTAQVTTLGGLPAGTPLNLEVDVIAKYVETMLSARFPDRAVADD